MNTKKLLNSQSTEDLLAALESNEEAKEVIQDNYDDDVLTFFSYYNIIPGEEIVTKALLYKLYKSWSKELIEKSMFYHYCELYLPKSNKTNKPAVLLNINALNIAKRTFDNLTERKREVTKSKKLKKHFELFLEQNEIKKGNYWLEGFTLYHLYDKWNYEIGRTNRLVEQRFLKLLKIYFNYKRKQPSKLNIYGVDRSILNHITEESLSRIREGHYAKEKEKRNKKKQRKISRLKARIKSQNKIRGNS